MASVTTVSLTDDIDGKKADETVAFALDGVLYEIDLRKTNANALRKALAEYIEHGRRVSRSSTPRPTAASRASVGDDRRRRREYLTAVRAWAEEAGLDVSNRGRIAQDVIDRYEAAQA
ncbi:Lsr2 family protein [Nakamurella sp. YIM 132087]|uniref:Lsr2 family protein n=1 Tax=Nakamurella alba TaxID=2665158 RepID=A0A7K1FI95_9ACTN|nr:Lsr2 family protein [Nakamurella alba]MTD13841.1 Lsr2 family protein [Nakamurella alba]